MRLFWKAAGTFGQTLESSGLNGQTPSIGRIADECGFHEPSLPVLVYIQSFHEPLFLFRCNVFLLRQCFFLSTGRFLRALNAEATRLGQFGSDHVSADQHWLLLGIARMQAWQKKVAWQKKGRTGRGPARRWKLGP
jgi:hypothetical protein